MDTNNKNLTAGLSVFNLVINSTMASTVNVEIFNNDQSVIKIYNPSNQTGAAKQFHPLVGVQGAPTILPVGNQTVGTTFAFAYLVGGVDTFTAAVKDVPAIPAGFNSNSYVYLDENGALVYQPGYNNGTLDSGQVTMQSTQTNYAHVFGVSGKCRFTINYARLIVGTTFTNQLQQDFSYIQGNLVGAASAVPFSAGTYVTENQYNSAIVTLPIQKEIGAKSGLSYPVLAQQAGPTPNQITMQLFFTPITPGMLTLL